MALPVLFSQTRQVHMPLQVLQFPPAVAVAVAVAAAGVVRLRTGTLTGLKAGGLHRCPGLALPPFLKR